MARCMLAVYRVLTLASLLTPLRHVHYVSNMVLVVGVRCSLVCDFHFECMNGTLHLCILPSVNTLPTLMHSEYLVQKHLYGFNSYSSAHHTDPLPHSSPFNEIQASTHWFQMKVHWLTATLTQSETVLPPSSTHTCPWFALSSLGFHPSPCVQHRSCVHHH